MAYTCHVIYYNLLSSVHKSAHPCLQFVQKKKVLPTSLKISRRSRHVFSSQLPVKVVPLLVLRHCNAFTETYYLSVIKYNISLLFEHYLLVYYL